MRKLLLLVAVLTILLSTFVSAQVDLDDGLVIYWNFEQTSGALEDIHNDSDSQADTVADKTNTGIVNGKNAWQLELGDSEFINISGANLAAMPANTDWSLSMWLNPESQAANIGLVWIGTPGGEPKTNLNFGDGSINIRNTGLNGMNCIGPAIPTAQWTHLLFVTNDSGSDCTIYVNGVPAALDETGDSDLSTDTILIGKRGFGSAFFYDGLIDDIAIWDRALDQADVLELNNSGNQAECTGDPCQFVPAALDPVISELIVTVTDRYSAVALTNFTVTVSNSTISFTNNTVTGEVRFSNVTNLSTYTVNITSNDSGGYFDLNNTLIFVNLTTTYVAEMFQAYVIFNATQLYTSIAINGLNVSAELQNNQSTDNLVVLFLNQSTFDINASANGQFNESITVTTTPLLNLTVTLTFSDSRFNITAFNSINNATITTGYTLNVSPGNGSASTTSITRSTTNENVTELPLLKGYNFTLTATFTDGNTVTTSRVLVVSDSTGLFSIFSTVLHTVNIQFFDEETNLPFQSSGVNNVSVTLEFIGPTVRNLTTLNGSLFVANLTPGDYEIRYESALFTKRSFFFRLPAGGSDDIDLYLLNSTLDTLIVITIVDGNDDPLNATILRVQRFYASENAFKTVEMSRANFNGEAPITIVQNTQEYRFIVLDVTGTSIIFSSTETKITGTTLKIRVKFGASVFDSAVGMSNVLTTMTHVESGNQSNFTFTFVDTSGFAISGCLDVFKLDFRGKSTLCQVCSSTSTGTLECSVDSSTELTAVGTVNNSAGQKVPVQTLTVSKVVPDDRFGGLGVLLAVFLIFAIATIGLSTGDLSITLFAGVIGVAISAAIGLLAVTAAIVFTLVGTVLIIILMGRNK